MLRLPFLGPMMSPNPDPARITDEMWRLWEERPNKAWKLGGIYANKPAYHNSVFANQKNWPNNYSIQLPLDLVNVNRDKARAIDYTMTEAEMIKTTKRMRDSALNPADDRLAAVKEFYGTLDGKIVYGLSKDNVDGPWERSSADSSHIWHEHISIFTAFVNKWTMLEPILSVLSGESLLDWRMKNVFLPKQGDTGQEVNYWQHVHNVVSPLYDPDLPKLTVDGIYGPKMSSAVKSFYLKLGGKGTFDGSAITGWIGMEYHRAMMKVTSPPPPSAPSLNEEQLKELVNKWFEDHVPREWQVTGNLTGKVVL